MIDKILDAIGRMKHGPVGVSIGVGVVVFTVIWPILQAVGIGGDPVVFLGLTLGALVLSFVVYAGLLHRRLRRLDSRHKSQAIPEVREKIEPLLARLDKETAEVIDHAIRQCEDKVRNLQSQFTVRELPGEPATIEGSSFYMGSENGQTDESPRHEIVVSSFLMDRFPITNQEFAEFIRDPSSTDWKQQTIYKKYDVPYYLCEFRGSNPPEDKWDHPVVWVNWFAAVAFCNWRSRRHRKEEVYQFVSDAQVDADFSLNGWRLPTEAEWEYAARCGLDTDQPWEGDLNPTIANYGKHYVGTTSVGRFGFNAFGLADLLGNVKEWCHDVYDQEAYKKKNRSNPRGPKRGKVRAFRGGSWMDPPEFLRFARRGKLPPQNTNPDFGFRCVRLI